MRTAWSSAELRVAVENGSGTTAPLAVPPSGYGLAGLRERLTLVGGTLDAGPTRTGWRTTLTLPTTTAASSASADKDEHP